MFNEADKNTSNEDKLNKFIEQKTNENKALKKMLDELNKENSINPGKSSGTKK